MPPQNNIDTPPNTRGDRIPPGFANISKPLDKLLFRDCDMLLFQVKMMIIH